MRCQTCNAENREEARFCASCGASLDVDVLCPDCGASTPPRARFCDSCGLALRGERASHRSVPEVRPPEHLVAEVLAARTSLGAERKQVTVFFADVQGSVNLAWSIDPEDWRQVMERFFSMLCEGVQRFDGMVDKFTGDGIMAIFGAPVAHEDHAQRACHAALHLQENLTRLSSELAESYGIDFAVRMGLNSGEVVVGTIGEDARATYTAMGRTVGLARRMEQLAQPGTALLSQYSARLAGDYFDLRDLGRVAVNGWPAPISVYELVGIGPLRTPLEVAGSRGLSRFVGRADEIELLDATLERALAGRGQTIGVAAGAGVGKSRLAHEFAERCRRRGVAVHAAHAVAYSRAQPLQPVRQILRSYLSVGDEQTRTDVRDAVRASLLRLDHNLESELPLLFDFLGLDGSDDVVPRIDPEVRERHLINLLKRVVQESSQSEPAVMVIEDVHWLDPASESFVRGVGDVIRATRALLMVTFRTEFRPDWLLQGDYQQLLLRPLAPDATQEMLGDLLGDDPSLDGLLEIIRERTAGNPFFIEELVRSLAEAGNLTGEKGNYRLGPPVDRIAVPETVQAVLAARIDRLPAEAQAVLHTAAVIGRQVPPRVLGQVSPVAESELAAALSALVDAAFLLERVDREMIYEFQHPLTLEVAYASQLSEPRSRMHAAVARALVDFYGEKVDERAGLIAYHWEMAGAALEAAEWSARAATWSNTRNRTQALTHWAKTMALLRSVPETPATIELGQRARIWWLELGWRVGISEQEATRVFAEGRELAERTADLASLAMLLTPYAFLMGQVGKLEQYIELSSEAVRAGDGCGDVKAQLGGYASLTHALFLSARLEDGLETVDRAIRVTGGDPAIEGGLGDVISMLAHFTRFRAAFLLHLGRLGEALPTLDRAVEIATERDDLEILAWTHATYPSVEGYLGGLTRESAVHAMEAVRISEQIGGAFLVWAYEALGQAYLLEGRYEEAADACERSLQVANDSGSGMELAPSTMAYLSEALRCHGQVDRALTVALEAVSTARRRNLSLYEITALLALGRAHGCKPNAGDVRDARGALDRALVLATEARARGIEPLIRIELARLRDTPDVVREQQLARARELLSANGAVGHLAGVEEAFGSVALRSPGEPAR
jgi:adenylate cyclase